MMDRIVRGTEQHKMYASIVQATRPDEEQTPTYAVATAAADLASTIHTKVIVA
jgi:pyruvate kinase